MYVRTGDQPARAERWLVACGLGGRLPMRMAVSKEARGLVPWAGIAAPLLVEHPTSQPLSLPDGRAFCFLPLPVSVGMPVHVNGYFELTSNRR